MKHDRPEPTKPLYKKPKQVKVSEQDSAAIELFKKANSQAGIRVFVAGGSRSGYEEDYTEAAYLLGQLIVKMDFKLDFGLSNSGIMGAVARGVLDGWDLRSMRENIGSPPIQGITIDTSEFNLQNVAGNLLQNGDNGAFGDFPLDTDEYSSELVKLFNGTYAEEIYNLDAIWNKNNV